MQQFLFPPQDHDYSEAVKSSSCCRRGLPSPRQSAFLDCRRAPHLEIAGEPRCWSCPGVLVLLGASLPALRLL